ncbi:hypothetical protein BDV24DRAFT_159870 [Aspergillus arachidicola]|uniref:EthD domain-containing protein n=1 Tax=Aspergillus arachidicola TaxID=656916 RepID=A0A5N6YKC9_9EURO|nr:hypothetical protein BDV24DRAFT_159870 [Aspergillus arachidicola]
MAPLIDHQFTHPQFSYSQTPNFQNAIKISVFFRKRAEISHDQFFTHWQTVHCDLVVATQAFRDNILRYVQHHQTPEMMERARSLGEGVLEYDACAQLWVRSWDDWLKFSGSEEYNNALGEDCQRFMQLPMTYMVGRENIVVGHGVPEIEGKDGFLQLGN